jgi:hypothetical protein
VQWFGLSTCEFPEYLVRLPVLEVAADVVAEKLVTVWVGPLLPETVPGLNPPPCNAKYQSGLLAPGDKPGSLHVPVGIASMVTMQRGGGVTITG